MYISSNTIKKESNRSRGFALPTVLIASIIMLGVLMVSISSAAAVRSGLMFQYYNQLAQNASDAGIAYAKSCLDSSSGIPKWTNATPLTPSTDCTGAQLVGLSCPADAGCYVASNGNVRSTFTVGLSDSDKDANGKMINIRSVGTTNLVRTSNGTTWRSFRQNSIFKLSYTDYTTNGLAVSLDAGNSGSINISTCPGTLTDLTGNGYNGVMYNGVACTSSGGGALTFDGVDDYVEIGSLGDMYNTATINVWFKTGSSFGNNRAIFATKYNGGYRGIRLYTDASGQVWVYFGNDDATSSIGLACTSSLVTSTWYNVALVLDKVNWTYGCYLNGEPKPDKANVIKDNVMWPNIIPDLVLGTGYGTGSNYFWNGSIAGIQIYNRILSAGEIRQNYQALAGRFN